MSKINNWMMKKYVELKNRDEEAQGLAEYGLILALIAVVCIGALGLLGTGVNAKLNEVVAGL